MLWKGECGPAERGLFVSGPWIPFLPLSSLYIIFLLPGKFHLENCTFYFLLFPALLFFYCPTSFKFYIVLPKKFHSVWINLAVDLSAVQQETSLPRVRKTHVSWWHCHLESFCASGKFFARIYKIAHKMKSKHQLKSE